MYLIGFGYDVHVLSPGRKLILGGVHIPFEKGLLGHSDADVLIHAIIDALLGALAKGDIGNHFPDHDPQYSDIDSRILLRRVFQEVSDAGWEINNLDCTICAQKPKLQPHIPLMRNNLAADLQCDMELISVKATTEEGLGVSGQGEGMAAYCTVMLRKRP